MFLQCLYAVVAKPFPVSQLAKLQMHGCKPAASGPMIWAFMTVDIATTN